MVVPFRAVKESHAHLFFQLAQRNTNRRRSATDALCGPANISCLHHCSEHFQLLKFHRLLINSKRPSSLDFDDDLQHLRTDLITSSSVSRTSAGCHFGNHACRDRTTHIRYREKDSSAASR